MLVSKLWCAYAGHVVGVLGCWRLTGQCQEMEDSGARLPAPWAGPRSLSSHSHSRHKSAHTSMIISVIKMCFIAFCLYQSKYLFLFLLCIFKVIHQRPNTIHYTFATFNKPKFIFNLLVQCLGSPEYKPGIIESSSKLVFFFNSLVSYPLSQLSWKVFSPCILYNSQTIQSQYEQNVTSNSFYRHTP